MLADSSKAWFDFMLVTPRLLEVITIEFSALVDNEVLGLGVFLFDDRVQSSRYFCRRWSNLKRSEPPAAAGEMVNDI